MRVAALCSSFTIAHNVSRRISKRKSRILRARACGTVLAYILRSVYGIQWMAHENNRGRETLIAVCQKYAKSGR